MNVLHIILIVVTLNTLLYSCKHNEYDNLKQTNCIGIIQNYIDTCIMYNRKVLLCNENSLKYAEKLPFRDSCWLYSLDSMGVRTVEKMIDTDMENGFVLLDSLGIVGIYSYSDLDDFTIKEASRDEIEALNRFFFLLKEKEINDDTLKFISELTLLTKGYANFYANFVLFQCLPESDSVNKVNICIKLWNDVTPFERNLYTTQLLSVFSYINSHLDCHRENLDFENRSCKLGDVEFGHDTISRFYFKNIGNNPVLILAAESSCGCTVASYPKYPIVPQMSDSIIVHFKGTTPGLKKKTITLKIHGSKSMTLTIEANVIGK